MKYVSRASRVRIAALFLGAASTAGCGSLRPCPAPANVPVIPEGEVDSVLFLIGDAGEADPAGEPVLEDLAAALNDAARQHGHDRVRVVFLGDNVYPAGLSEEGGSGRAEAERKLDAQLDVLAAVEPAADPSGVFVPGNHDWDHNRTRGLARIRGQGSYLEGNSEGRAGLLPAGGCPGPVAVDVGERLRILALDTQWWIRTGDKPSRECEAGTEEAVAELLGRQLEQAGDRHAVVVGHHPFLTGGPHGGATLFLRRLGLVPQDVSGGRYRRMIQTIEKVFAEHPPLVYAAGHDHGLQLLKDEKPYYVVSGAGSMENATRVAALDETRFCSEGSGYVRLDFAHDGRVRLASLVVAEGAPLRASEVFSTYLAE